MKKLILFCIVFLMMLSIVYGAKPTTTTTTTTTTSTTTTTLSTNYINPELRYLENYPILRQAIKNRIITYINNNYNVCVKDLNLNPDHLPFRFRTSNFYVVEVTTCDGNIYKLIKQRQTFRERFLT